MVTEPNRARRSRAERMTYLVWAPHLVLVAVSQKETAWQLAVPREFCQIGKGWQGVAGWQMREIIHFSYWLLPIYICCLLEYIVTL